HRGSSPAAISEPTAIVRPRGESICYRPASLLQRPVQFTQSTVRRVRHLIEFGYTPIESARMRCALQRGRPVHLIRQSGILSSPVESVLLGDPSEGELEVRHELATARRTTCGRQAACRKKVA